MKNAIRFAVGAAALVAGNAWAVEADARPLYVKASVGQTEAEVNGFSLSEGAAYGAALGAAVGPVRVEAGVDRLSGDFQTFLEADALDYHASAFLDLPIGDKAALFAGAGVDYIDGQANVFGTEIDASGDGYHWAIGGAYRFSENVIGEVQFRQVSATLDADFIGDVDLDANVVTFGLRMAL